MNSYANRRLFLWLALAVAAALGAVLHLRGIGGAFLADDFSHLDVISRVSGQSGLLAWTLARFHEPLGNGTFAYRPLAFASYVLDWLVHGNHAAGWRFTSLALHSASALAAGLVVVRWLGGQSPQAVPAAMVAGAALFAFPFAGEVTYWLAGRFDLLACLFTLLFLLALPLHRPSTAGQHLWRVGFLLCALAAKESAIPLPLVATLLAFAFAAAGKLPGESGLRRGARFATAEMWPAWLVLGAYLLFRTWLFGSPLKVYPNLPLTESVAEFWQRLSGLGTIASENIGTHYLAWAVLSAAALLAIVLVCIGARRSIPKPIGALMLALLIAAALYLLSPALSIPVSSPDGEGARHFYLAWAYATLLLGMLAAWRPSQWKWGMAFVLLMLAGQAQSLGQWQAAGRQMQAVIAGVDAMAAKVGDDQYALLLLPDHIGVALFARTAQDAIVIPPTQRRNYLDRMAGMLGTDFAVWSRFIADGKIAELKGKAEFDPANFVGLYCWNPGQSAFVRLTPGSVARDPDLWQALAQRDFAQAGCLSPF